ncbi:hypothetical protein [Streptomyces sp. NPDC046727]|uniref:hypothetical protein n=1 Tax=Streptomyces sp. NPDC046727 TaxID=3155373 RepID=UPI0033F1CA90
MSPERYWGDTPSYGNGHQVWWVGTELKPSHDFVKWEPSLAVVKGDIGIGVRSDLTVYVKAEACYWWGNWKCTHFDQEVLHLS